MTARPAPYRSHLRRDPIVVIGTVLVLALVAVLPLALALTSGDSGGDETGIGSGVGELSAAALSALHRDINTKRSAAEALPALETCATPHFLTAFDHPHAGSDEQMFSPHDPTHGSTDSPAAPGAAQAGPGPNGIPLLL